MFFNLAKSTCSSDGAHLITIRTEEEARVFKEYTGAQEECNETRQYCNFFTWTFRKQGWLLLLDWSGESLGSHLSGPGLQWPVEVGRQGAVLVRPGLGGVVRLPDKNGQLTQGSRGSVHLLGCKFHFFFSHINGMKIFCTVLHRNVELAVLGWLPPDHAWRKLRDYQGQFHLPIRLRWWGCQQHFCVNSRVSLKINTFFFLDRPILKWLDSSKSPINMKPNSNLFASLIQQLLSCVTHPLNNKENNWAKENLF